MPRTNRPSRRDANHAEVVAVLEQAGYTVSDTSAVGVRVDKHQHATGALDTFVAKYGVTILVEIKNGKGKLNENESIFFEQWKGEKIVVYSGQDAFNQCDAIIQKWIPF